MGYRSDIVSAVVWADAAHNTQSMVKWKLHCAKENWLDVLCDDEDIKACTSFIQIDGKYPSAVLQVSGWKWYDSYEGVQGWHRFLDFMRDECQAAVTFIRIGEETEDIVEDNFDSEHPGLADYFPWDWFRVQRSIHTGLGE